MPDLAARDTFTDVFGVVPEAAGEAPARVNLMGEHTDYHEGLVLPTVLPQRTCVWVHRRATLEIRAISTAIGGPVAAFTIGQEQRSHQWIDYVQGITSVLHRHGTRLSGFDLSVASTIPVGAGVSSSAALIVSVLRALRTAFGLRFDDIELARLAQMVETDFVGVPVGIMDQMVCSLGRAGEALFLDTRTLMFEHVPLPASADLVVVHSGVSHQHASGDYVRRRTESFEAAKSLAVSHLRDVAVEELSRLGKLPPRLAARARHVITENQRVRDAVLAIQHDDVVRLGGLFNASHESMRHDYEISTPEVDRLISISRAHPAVYGARMTGGGFGGAVVVLAARGRGREVAVDVMARYQPEANTHGAILAPLDLTPSPR